MPGTHGRGPECLRGGSGGSVWGGAAGLGLGVRLGVGTVPPPTAGPCTEAFRARPEWVPEATQRVSAYIAYTEDSGSTSDLRFALPFRCGGDTGLKPF